MLNPFPDLLTFGFFAPLLLRVALGVLFVYEANRLAAASTKASAELKRWFGSFAEAGLRLSIALYGIVGIALIAGFYTQIAAILAAAAAFKLFLLGKHAPALAPHGRALYALVVAVALSLLLSGAGAIAFDLPL